MSERKANKKYYFSVEGETEQWYLEWLASQINSSDQSKFSVSFDVKIQKDPVKRVKSMVITKRTEIWHLSDYESAESVHVDQFYTTMDRLKETKSLGKEVTYHFGYTNLAFDLWIVLHKANCNSSLAHRSHYLSHINRAYNEHFESMDEYKHEDNFNRCLRKLSLANVLQAITRAQKIMQRNQENGYILHEYKGYRFYKENPSLELWQAIKSILADCKLID